MKKRELLDEILQILHTVKEDKNKLQLIHQFFYEKIYEEPEEIEIPEKYKKVVAEIADSIDAGFISYMNPDTLETEEIQKNILYDPDRFGVLTDNTLDDWDLKHDRWKKCITFAPLESHESFKIMEQFAIEMEDVKFQEKLITILNRRKPFANFKAIIDNSIYRQNWFDFKTKWLENHVKELLVMEIEDLKDNFPEEINGLYDDNGTKIDPESIPVPELCITCKSYHSGDSEENLFCTMNRYDQQNDTDFKCKAFENK